MWWSTNCSFWWPMNANVKINIRFNHVTTLWGLLWGNPKSTKLVLMNFNNESNVLLWMMYRFHMQCLLISMCPLAFVLLVFRLSLVNSRRRRWKRRRNVKSSWSPNMRRNTMMRKEVCGAWILWWERRCVTHEYYDEEGGVWCVNTMMRKEVCDAWILWWERRCVWRMNWGMLAVSRLAKFCRW